MTKSIFVKITQEETGEIKSVKLSLCKHEACILLLVATQKAGHDVDAGNFSPWVFWGIAGSHWPSSLIYLERPKPV